MPNEEGENGTTRGKRTNEMVAVPEGIQLMRKRQLGFVCCVRNEISLMKKFLVSQACLGVKYSRV